MRTIVAESTSHEARDGLFDHAITKTTGNKKVVSVCLELVIQIGSGQTIVSIEYSGCQKAVSASHMTETNAVG